MDGNIVAIRERFDEVKESLINSVIMPPFDTEQFTDAATECVIDHGRVVNTKEKLEIIRSLSLEEIRDMLRPVTFERARTVIFKGVGSS